MVNYDKINAEVAIYPLKTKFATNIIDKSIKSLKYNNVDYTVNSMNTHLIGDRKEVFNSLEFMFNEAEKTGGEVSMVITVSNACE